MRKCHRETQRNHFLGGAALIIARLSAVPGWISDRYHQASAKESALLLTEF